MERFYELDQLQAQVDIEAILKTMDCHKESPLYEEMEEECREIYEEMQAYIEPKGIIGFAEMPQSLASVAFPAGTPIAYVVLSIGAKVSEASTKAFQTGDPVRGMICDAIAVEALFSLEESMQKDLKKACREHQVGVKKRLEAPQDLPMEAQKEAWEYLELKRRFGIGLSTGYMYDPVKTSCQIFILTSDQESFHAEHDCTRCTNFKCSRRKVSPRQIRVKKDGEVRTITVNDLESVMTALQREGYYISAFCGGKGHCGKCRVRVAEGSASVSEEERKIFTSQELENGWRLSCMLYPTQDLLIEFNLNDETEFAVVSEHELQRDMELDTGAENAIRPVEQVAADSESEEECCIAVDIGTTTLVFGLFGVISGKQYGTVTRVNSQRQFGADVVSRILASTEGKGEKLQQCICSDLSKGIIQLLGENRENISRVRKIVIAGNTTMIHLLLGYDCQSLGVYPYTPVNIDFISSDMDEDLHDIFQMILQEIQEQTGDNKIAKTDIKILIFPGISTYVGGDIVAGLYSCGIDEKEDVSLFIDLGTNGEMAIGNKNKILVASTAAGPAFEGGNITCGVGSVKGAVCCVKIEDRKSAVKTIGGELPIGICGTGVVEATAELLKEELLAETGLLEDEYFENGFELARTKTGEPVVLTQKDIREIQLAKGAIRAGAETLMQRYHIEKEQIKTVYLAGGFGYCLDPEKAVAIGMLPEEFLGKIKAVGNTSFGGAAKWLKEDGEIERLEKLVSLCEEVDLSRDKKFQDLYMEAMLF